MLAYFCDLQQHRLLFHDFSCCASCEFRWLFRALLGLGTCWFSLGHLVSGFQHSERYNVIVCGICSIFSVIGCSLHHKLRRLFDGFFGNIYGLPGCYCCSHPNVRTLMLLYWFHVLLIHSHDLKTMLFSIVLEYPMYFYFLLTPMYPFSEEICFVTSLKHVNTRTGHAPARTNEKHRRVRVACPHRIFFCYISTPSTKQIANKTVLRYQFVDFSLPNDKCQTKKVAGDAFDGPPSPAGGGGEQAVPRVPTIFYINWQTS